MVDYPYATVRQLRAALDAREVGAEELARAAIARIERLDGPINAVVIRDFERALAAARAADQALAAGERAPLLGVPMTVKESFGVAGLPHTWGAEGFRELTAAEDAVAVSRLKSAGAVILGKTNVPPMLADWQSANAIWGRTSNPWDLTRSPGGSSGGSAAALAAGFVPLEFGSDIGGSIRVPAAFCGVFGHKPSYKLVPSRGHGLPGLEGEEAPLAVVGPLARTAEDLTLALDLVAGPDSDMAHAYRLELPPPRRPGLSGMRVLILDRHPAAATDGPILAALHGLGDELARVGATVLRSHPDLPDLTEATNAYLSLLNSVITRGRPDAQPISAHAYLDALDVQHRTRARWAAVFREVDIVLAPVFGSTAFPHTDAPWGERSLTIDGAETPYGAQLAWPSVALFGALPATAFPAGLSPQGLPIGLQAIGPFLEDRTPLAFVAAVERELGRTFQPPPLEALQPA
ncbi:MAG: amidase family protein [Phenylobacterium sp.]|jgi:amidase|uniref:amidase family protein n=1 Tax=Phenylobacterium sp. TaxID=1871053 RepID=UPI002A2FDA89|nr:amidase family protein [Phenylobacterium sp.]MDD3838898.1 amidase family protein [Phenylobacterium sp.]MDX9997544.1 amidase family protein [Phenylobacterium sp.]